VPFFILGGSVGVSGAQPVDVFARALEQTWTKLQAQPEQEPAAE